MTAEISFKPGLEKQALEEANRAPAEIKGDNISGSDSLRLKEPELIDTARDNIDN